VKIRQNYNNNKDRYELGRHFYLLDGDELQELKNKVENFDLVKQSRHLMLWTEKGALLHAKSLNTDKAWQVYEMLVDTYFKAKEMFSIPKSLPEALRLAAELADQIEKDRPLVAFAETCIKSKDSILIRELAKIARNKGVDIGEHKLYKKLRDWEMLMPNNEPYQRYINAGYFEVSEKPYNTFEGVKLALTTRVLPRGQQYIMRKLAEA